MYIGSGEKKETPLIEMRKITKTFPGVIALNGVDFSVKAGEIHALLGENGSGKSTLIKILSGVQPADEGEVYFEGHLVDWKNPLDAQKVGVATIHQEINLIPNIDIASNMFLNWEPMVRNSVFINFKEMYRKTSEVLKDMGVALDPKIKAARLSAAEKQLVEIAKAIAKEMKVLVLDEPTAALPAHEVEILFEIIERLKQRGIGIIFVSHRLEEIERLADRVTIIRDGRLVTTKDKAELTIDEIVCLMIGRDVQKVERPGRIILDEEVLRVNGFTKKRAFHNISLQLKKGEILGIAGLVGCGRSEVIAALGGALPYDEGQIIFHEKEIKISSAAAALMYGIGFLPSERKTEGLFTQLSVKQNIVMASLKKLSTKGGVLLEQNVSPAAREFVDKLKIKITSIHQKAGSLSGGNQQKLVLAKVLARGSKVLVFDEPTRGIDVGTRYEIYSLLNELALTGNSIILSSSDLPELIQTCDRILVLYKGRLVAEYSHGVSQEEILRAVLGQARTVEETQPESEIVVSPDGSEMVKRKPVNHSKRQKVNISQMISRSIGVPLFILALIIFFSFEHRGFAGWANIANLSHQVSILLIISIAQAFAIITRGVDMSVGSTMAIVSMIVGIVGLGTGNFLLGILAGLLVGVLAGLLNAAIIGSLGADPFIVTLGVMYIGRGTSMLVNDGQSISGFPSWFAYISDGKLGPVPVVVIIALFFAVICQIVITKTRFGRYLTAIGGNADGARISGVRVGFFKGAGYLMSAVLSGFIGIVMTARFLSSQPNLGISAHLETITAAIIGGISLEGGRGDVWAVLTGVLLIGILSNGMNITRVPVYIQLIVMGGVLIFSLILDYFKRKGQRDRYHVPSYQGK